MLLKRKSAVSLINRTFAPCWYGVKYKINL